MPYDYAARLELIGVPGNLVQDVINIGPDGVFVAVGIGYGFEADRTRPVELFEAVAPGGVTTPVIPAHIRLHHIPPHVLAEGFQVNPRSENLMFEGDLETPSPLLERRFSSQPVAQELANKVLQQVKAVRPITFLFSAVDSSSGRELQDEPTFSLASLGKSDGERPFRMLAQPLSFLPRSTIRIQIEERTADAQGTLFVVLYGYKILVNPACSEDVVQAMAVADGGDGPSGSRVIPFDYVVKFELSGRPHNRLQDEFTVNAEGGFVATGIGYGLVGTGLDVELLLDRVPALSSSFLDPLADPPQVHLSEVPLAVFPTQALIEGVRIRPGYLRLAFQAGGTLATVPRSLADNMFETLNQPEDVSFRYMFFDTGSGREWQNVAINNVAGLGIANGKRPFKKLARPMVFAPRSTIQVTVDEQFGRGQLFIVLQGYKVLGTGAGAVL